MQPDVLADLFSGARQYTYSKGQTVISFGVSGGLYYVKSGYIKRYTLDKYGTASIQSVYGPGYFFPLTPVFVSFFDLHTSQTISDYVYRAMSDTVLLRTDISILTNYLQKNPDVYKDLLFEAGRRLESNIHMLENLALKDAYRRTAHQLAFLVRKFGKEAEGGLQLDIPVTHQDLADMLSLTRETVSRQMSRLRRRQVLTVNRHITVTNLAALEAAFS